MDEPAPDAMTGEADAEAALVRSALDGDLEAFNSLVDLHQRAVFNLCLRMLGSSHAAEDAAQEAFLSAYKGMHTFRGTNFRPWLMRIAANACTDELRRRGRRPALSLDAPVPGTDDHIDVPDRGVGPEVETLRLEQAGQVQEALMTLPAEQRLAVVMCDIQGFAYEEIAIAMKCSVGTVKSRIARGRDKLRKELAWMKEQSSNPDRQRVT
jgi:RNA polymerase sigma-70 factor (ECF subfamily)